jgi:hypothetical protein
MPSVYAPQPMRLLSWNMAHVEANWREITSHGIAATEVEEIRWCPYLSLRAGGDSIGYPLLQIRRVRYLYTLFGQAASGDLTEICIQTSDKADRFLEARRPKRLGKPSVPTRNSSCRGEQPVAEIVPNTQPLFAKPGCHFSGSSTHGCVSPVVLIGIAGAGGHWSPTAGGSAC